MVAVSTAFEVTKSDRGGWGALAGEAIWLTWTANSPEVVVTRGVVTGSLTTGGELGVPGPDRQASVGCDSALVPSAKSRVFVPAAPCKTVGALDGSNLWVGRDATVRTGAMSCGDRAVALPAVSAATGAVLDGCTVKVSGEVQAVSSGTAWDRRLWVPAAEPSPMVGGAPDSTVCGVTGLKRSFGTD